MHIGTRCTELFSEMEELSAHWYPMYRVAVWPVRAVLKQTLHTEDASHFSSCALADNLGAAGTFHLGHPLHSGVCTR